MICCLCGEEIDLDDTFIKLQQFKLSWSTMAEHQLQIKLPMEDGTQEKILHFYPCAFKFGIPLIALGIGGDRINV